MSPQCTSYNQSLIRCPPSGPPPPLPISENLLKQQHNMSNCGTTSGTLSQPSTSEVSSPSDLLPQKFSQKKRRSKSKDNGSFLRSKEYKSNEKFMPLICCCSKWPKSAIFSIISISILFIIFFLYFLSKFY